MLPGKKTPWMPLCLLLALGAIWGSGYSLARFATTHGVSPLGYAFWQSLGPTCLLLAALKIRRISFSWSRPALKFYLICGLAGIAFPNSNMYFAAAHLPAGLLAVIVNMAPLMTYTLSFLLQLERFYYLRLLAVLLGVAGILCLVVPQASLPASHSAPWVLLALLTPLGFAGCAVYITQHRPLTDHSLALSAGMLLSSTLFLGPIVGLTHSFYPMWPPFGLQDGAILLEMVLSSIGYVLMFLLLQRAGAVYYSLVGGVVALTGLFWGWLLFGETWRAWDLVAVVLIIAAILLITLWPMSKAVNNRWS